MNEQIVGFTCGAFDLLHTGHLHLFEQCKKECDSLIIGLHTDPTIDRPTSKNKPIQSIFERYQQLVACKFVDKIIPYDTEADLVNMMAVLPIHIRFMGSEYLSVNITGDLICDTIGIKMRFIERFHRYSSTELRGRLK